MKGFSGFKSSPAKQPKELDHVGKPYMRPPYKDRASGIRPYEKRQGYHGFKDFESIIPQFQTDFIKKEKAKQKKSPAKY